MTPEVPFNIFNELKEIREHLLQQEDYYLYLWGFFAYFVLRHVYFLTAATVKYPGSN